MQQQKTYIHNTYKHTSTYIHTYTHCQTRYINCPYSQPLFIYLFHADLPFCQFSVLYSCSTTKISAHNKLTRQRTSASVCRFQLRANGHNLTLFFENPRFSFQPSTACLFGTNGANFAFSK
jgi:hypothetical protein